MKKMSKRAVVGGLILGLALLANAGVALAAPGAGTGAVVSDPGAGTGAVVSDSSACGNLASNGVAGVVGCIISLINYALYLIMAFSVLYVVWGAFNMMREEKREEGKQTIYYGIIGLFVMISVWGLVNILSATFGGLADAPAHSAPQLIRP
jgi:hypothetical protein